MDVTNLLTNLDTRRKQLADLAKTRADGLRSDAIELWNMPLLTINLMLKRTVDNDPFWRDLTLDWFHEATMPHPKLRVIRNLKWGCAVCILPRTHNDYFMLVEAAARRNFKKAQRSGYTFSRINSNEHLDGIREIRMSTDVRQGKMPEDYLRGEVKETKDPPSRNHYHAYPYFGVFHEKKLVAYSSCFIAGELCSLEHTLGHADHQSDGIVPMMLIGIAEELYKDHPAVRYFMYGTYFGAAQRMRRFKKKFRFFPTRVDWRLDARETAE
ncbi:MAG: hypothetical protein MUF54_17735 [Polyangiaceae bacterium]|nr:hypothetical protein [Polyangiaceae bacterium]